MNHKRLRPEDAQRFLRALFIGAEIATFEYWADFIVRLQRNVPRDRQEIEHESAACPRCSGCDLKLIRGLATDNDGRTRRLLFPFKSFDIFPLGMLQ